MKVGNHMQNLQSHQLQKNKHSESQQKSSAEARARMAGGEAEISSRAKEFSRATALAKATAAKVDPSREEKIAELRRRIQNREYNVKPDAIADRMVDEHLKTSMS